MAIMQFLIDTNAGIDYLGGTMSPMVYNLWMILLINDIRKTYKTKLPDAIIATTALIYDLTLITRNINDFKNINKLNVINPWNI